MAGTMARRGLLAGAAALVAGIVAKQASEPVAALTDTNFVANGTATYGFQTNGAFTFGVSANGTSAGVSGTGGPYGVIASGSTYGVTGFGSTAGVYGSSPTTGVLGEIVGNQANSIAVRGNNTSTGPNCFGVQGSSSLSHGVVGLSGTGAGASGVVAVGQSPGTVGFQGVAQGGALYAGYFFGDVSINKRVSDGQGGNLGVAGAKFAIVKGQDGKYRGMYAVESPECWFEDFGTGKVVNGKAAVTLDPLFAQHVHTDEYHVFITPHDADHHLAVTGRSAAGFAVAASASAEAVARGKQASDLNGTFSYRVVAKRNDIKGERMPIWEMPPAVNGSVPPAPPSEPSKEPPPGQPPQPAPSPRPPTASTPAAQGSGPTAGTGASPVQPAPPPRP